MVIRKYLKSFTTNTIPQSGKNGTLPLNFFSLINYKDKFLKENVKLIKFTTIIHVYFDVKNIVKIFTYKCISVQLNNLVDSFCLNLWKLSLSLFRKNTFRIV